MCMVFFSHLINSFASQSQRGNRIKGQVCVEEKRVQVFAPPLNGILKRDGYCDQTRTGFTAKKCLSMNDFYSLDHLRGIANVTGYTGSGFLNG